MKNKETKKEVKKFDLEKMKFAKLKNAHLIVGGGGDDPDTGTATSANCHNKSAACKGGDNGGVDY